MRISFFKAIKPKQFNYLPRYYDEQKEEFDKRQKRIEAELGLRDDDGSFQSSLKQGTMSKRLAAKRQKSRSSTIRLLIIILILMFLALYFLRDVPSLSDILK